MAQINLTAEEISRRLELAKTAAQAEDLEQLKSEMTDTLGDIRAILEEVTGSV